MRDKKIIKGRIYFVLQNGYIKDYTEEEKEFNY